MLITFQSRASADVLMFGQIAQQLLSIAGKAPNVCPGIFTVEQLPDAIARLRAAIDEDRARQRVQPETEDEEPDPSLRGMGAPVSLAQRAVPLLQMCEYALAERVPVTWE